MNGYVSCTTVPAFSTVSSTEMSAVLSEFVIINMSITIYRGLLLSSVS